MMRETRAVKAWKKVLRKLISLPPKERYLAAGLYVNRGGKCGCAIGKLLPHGLRMKLLETHTNMAGISTSHFQIKAIRSFLSRRFGLSGDLPQALQDANDDSFYFGQPTNAMETMKARYRFVIGWIEAEITGQ